MSLLPGFKKYFYPLLFSFLFFIVFLVLAFWVRQNPENSFDRDTLLSLQKISSPLLDQLMILVSVFGETFVAIVLSLVLSVWLFIKNQKTGLFLIAVAFAIFLSSEFFKILFGRPRPDIFIVEGYSRPSSFGYPSGHVAFYTIYFGFIFFLSLISSKTKLWLRLLFICISLALIILIGYSRVYLGVHWTTDVIGGYLLGFSLLLPFLILFLIFEKR